MKTLRILLAAILIAVAPASFVGCATTRTHEAVVFDSFKSTYNVTYAAYTSWLELVVQGKVTKAKEQRVDAAWNDFRTAFGVAFQAASADWNAATPANVQKLSETLISVIRSL